MSKKTLFIVTGIALVLAIGLFLLAKANKQRIIEVDPGFSKYISGYTSGAQSRIAPVEIEFVEPLPKSLTDKELVDLFSIQPFTAGSLEQINDRVIQFTPKVPLLSDQLYTVSFALGETHKVESKYANFEFQFSTFAQDLSIDLGPIQAYMTTTPDVRFLYGSVEAADFADSAQLAKAVSATLDGKTIKVKMSGYNGHDKLNFVIDSIQRKEEKGRLRVDLNGQSLGLSIKDFDYVEVPELGNYIVTSSKVLAEEEGDQYIEIAFSEKLLPQQNLNGIIQLEGETNLNFHIEENIVRVYLPNLMVGDKLLSVGTGIKDGSGYRMKKPYSKQVHFDPPLPRVRLHSSGSILPNSQGLIFPFETVSLKSVDVRVIRVYERNVHHFLQVNDLDGEDELSRFGKIVAEKHIKLNIKKGDSIRWTSHVIDLNKLIKPERGAIYRVGIKFDRDDSACGCETDDQSEMVRNNDESWSERTWKTYLYSYDEYESWRSYRDRTNPCDPEYYRGKAVSRNILASDLGIVFKLDQDKRGHVFVSNMVSATPIANASILFYDYTNDLITSGTTDARGMIALPLSRKPFLLIAKHGAQRGYLKLSDRFTNSTSRFDVEGENLEKAVKGVFYGERGVWRPGDSLFLSFVLNDPHNSIPLNHPISFELDDPSGRTVSIFSTKKNGSGSYVFRTATPHHAKTGYYSVSTRIGNHYFSKTLRIETVKPNRLKVHLAVKEKSDSSSLQAKWLHGANAQHLQAKVSRVIRPARSTFPKYPSYQFDSPIRSTSSRQQTLFDGKLDGKGEAQIPSKLTDLQTAAGFLDAVYTTRVFEKSGDFSIAVQTEKVTPFKTMLGLEVPKTSFSGTLDVDKRHHFSVVALSPVGMRVTAEKVHLKIYRIYHPWWSEQGAKDLMNYVTRTANITVLDSMISVKNGLADFDFQVHGENYGNYLITLTDTEGGHQTGARITFDYPYWSRTNRSGNEHAKMLDFASNEKNYRVGETVQLTIPSPENGRALVSVETGEKVVKKFWQSTHQGDNQIAFQVDRSMFPNAYVHVTLIQPHHTTTNDRPIRMYGIIPIEVDDSKTHLNPVITMKESVRPNRKTSVTVKEQFGRKMTYTLAVVDDGLLDITNFRTPNPWRAMYARRSLGVQTWDMYDDVIGAYAGSMKNLLSIGGDGWDDEVTETPKANRFKPMVRFIGPFTLSSGSKQHIIDIPNYVGSVRVMVIAQNDGAYGKAEKTVTVKQPVMVLATLPRLIGPSEKMKIPITVFAMEEKVKEVEVQLESNDFIQLKKKRFTVSFSQTGDQVINVPMEVAEKMGIGKLKVTARSGNEVAYHEIEVDVRAPNPILYEGGEYELEPGEEKAFPVSFFGISGSNKVSFEVSHILPIGLNKRLDYLIQYPHGCIEQTTSSVFPQLFLSQMMELDQKDKHRIESNVKDGIKRIASFQTADGGFAYWPGNYDSDEWGSNYAGHFLLIAEKMGYTIPSEMKNAWVSYQKNAAQESKLYRYSQLTQAYRLFTLALCGEPELSAMNRMREQSDISEKAKWRLATAYYLIGQKEVARKMVENLPCLTLADDMYAHTYGSSTRDQGMILESLALMGDEFRGRKLVKELSASLNSDHWYSTQTTAYTLLGISTYYGVNAQENAPSFTIGVDGKREKSVTSKSNVNRMVFSEDDIKKKGTVTLKNTGKAKLFVKMVTEGIPLENKQGKQQNNLTLSLVYRDMEGNQIDPKEIQQGTDFIAEVKVWNPGKKGDLQEIALSHLFPNGWEIHNARMYGGRRNSQVDFQDIRDDRIYSYFDLESGKSITIKTQLNAAYLGEFYHPTIQVETMYNHLINASLPGSKVKVVE